MRVNSFFETGAVQKPQSTALEGVKDRPSLFEPKKEIKVPEACLWEIAAKHAEEKFANNPEDFKNLSGEEKNKIISEEMIKMIKLLENRNEGLWQIAENTLNDRYANQPDKFKNLDKDTKNEMIYTETKILAKLYE